MLYYPQLTTGTLVHYPLRKTLQKRTILNECLDSRTVKLEDAGANSLQWDLSYSGLSAPEWSAIEALFQASEGRLQRFVFLDPTDNLLRWSETLTSGVWQKDALLQLSAGVSDPAGSTRATRVTNAGPVSEELSQSVEAAGWFQYCFSVYARCASGGAVTLTRRTADGEDSRAQVLGPQWQRLVNSGQIPGTPAAIEFAIRIPAGMIVDLYGLQAEAQPQPSAYKKTTSQGGVYPATRFAEDSLRSVAAGLNDYSVEVKLTSRAGD
jgi:hypothetical protein